jgi:transposase
MDLTDEQWQVVEPLIPVPPRRPDGRGRPRIDAREILNGILWVMRTGAPWRDMPERYPSYQTCCHLSGHTLFGVAKPHNGDADKPRARRQACLPESWLALSAVMDSPPNKRTRLNLDGGRVMASCSLYLLSVPK